MHLQRSGPDTRGLDGDGGEWKGIGHQLSTCLTSRGDAALLKEVAGALCRRPANRVGLQEDTSFAALWLAYALPCRRFAAALTDDDARLGADVDRYSFIATDLHRLLLAGLPAHSH